MGKKQKERPRLEEMVEWGVRQVFLSLGKGESLNGVMYGIIMGAAQWGADNAKERAAEVEGRVSE